MIKRLYLAGSCDKEGIPQLADTLLSILKGRRQAQVVGSDFTGLRDLSGLEADLVIVLGGDGSIIGTVRRMGPRQLPLLGIHVGQLGFLTAFLDGQMEHAIDMALAGRLMESPRLMGLVQVQPDKDSPPRWTARMVNDMVLGRPRDRGILSADVEVGGTFVGAYTGDGVIISTPCGSTAYCLSSGGPVLVPDMESFVIVPLACHTLALRPLVHHASQEVRLTINPRSRSGTGILAVDGQLTTEVTPGEVITVRATQEKFRLLVDPSFNFFQALREKFGWTGQPRYRQ